MFIRGSVLAVLLDYRDSWVYLPVRSGAPAAASTKAAHGQEGKFDFLRIPAVWMCFAFFFFYAMALSVVQTFAPAAAAHLHDVPAAWVAIMPDGLHAGQCRGYGAGGLWQPTRSAVSALWVSVWHRGVDRAGGGAGDVAGCHGAGVVWRDGFSAGIAGPSRDLLVKRSTPENATGRVYGVVYSGSTLGRRLHRWSLAG